MSVNREKTSLAVVGAGPAGLAAAEILTGAGHAVTVYDRMPSVGRKLLIAGRGGLNLTHSEPLADFLSRYQPAHPALIAAIEAFPPVALRAWCEGLGIETFVGSSGRVFPKSFKASPLLRAWLVRLEALGVVIRTRHRLVAAGPEGLAFESPDGRIVQRPDAALFALGGASWPRLGSDAAWLPMMQANGIETLLLRPANVGFDVAWSPLFAERFAGQPLKRVVFHHDCHSIAGEAIITRSGIEGGAVYALSRSLRETIESTGRAEIALDLRPDCTFEYLRTRLAAAKHGDSLSNRLRKAAGLSPLAIGLLREGHGAALSKDPARLASAIKATTLTLVAIGPIERAISSAGGVSFDAIDEHFMLKARPGWFAAGEMLDWEAPTGGYLLQGCFATGRAAALGMLSWLDTAPAGPAVKASRAKKNRETS